MTSDALRLAELQLEALQREALRREARTDLLAFTRYTMPSFQTNWHHVEICRQLERWARGEIKRLIITCPPRHGKALALDTPVATPEGWTTIGDLRVGDSVFGVDGKPVEVIAKSPVWRNRDVWRVTTTSADHARLGDIYADADHVWNVRLCRKEGVFRLKTTAQLAVRTSKRNPLTPSACAIDCLHADLPIDPYVLGVWLGDGCSHHATITAGDDDIASTRHAVELAGYETTDRATRNTFGVLGLQAQLRAAGLLGNKHVPDAYLRGSADQRLALLQGLVDTDGHVTPTGQVEFCSTSKPLAVAVAELVASLGVKRSVLVGDATLKGRKISDKYRVMFYMANAARLPRKSVRCRNGVKSTGHYLKFEPAGTADTQCIQVDAADGMFLAGRAMVPTHNSELVSRRLPAWLFGVNPDARVISTSYGQELSNSFSLDVKNIMAEPSYGDLFEGVKPFSKHYSHAWKTNTVRHWHLQNPKHRGYYLCAGVRGGISGRGMTHGIIDDPFKDIGQANSATVRAATWAWYWSAFWTRKAPGASILITTTRWHLDDLVGKLLNSKEQLDVEPWTVIDLPAEMYDDDTLSTVDCDPRETGEYLWPDRFSAEELAPIKRVPDVWNSAYQQRPTSKSGGVFREAWFQRYNSLPPGGFSKFLLSIDASFGSEKASASDVCIELYGQVKDAPAQIYLLDEICEPMEFGPTIDAILKMLDWWQAYAPRMIKLLELKANGAAILNVLKKKVPGIVTVTPTESKYARAVSVSPTVASGCLFVPSPDYMIQGRRRATWADDYVDQMCAFPFGPKDDRVDCTSQALDYLIGKAFELLMGRPDVDEPEEVPADKPTAPAKEPMRPNQLTMSRGSIWNR